MIKDPVSSHHSTVSAIKSEFHFMLHALVTVEITLTGSNEPAYVSGLAKSCCFICWLVLKKLAFLVKHVMTN